MNAVDVSFARTTPHRPFFKMALETNMSFLLLWTHCHSLFILFLFNIMLRFGVFVVVCFTSSGCSGFPCAIHLFFLLFSVFTIGCTLTLFFIV